MHWMAWTGGSMATLWLMGCASEVDEPSHDEETHWSYGGAEGPEHWGDLSEEFKTCSTGEEQSPVDLLDELPKKDMDDLAFDYVSTKGWVVDNGHTIVVELEDLANEVLIEGQAYSLLQFHFHAASEHRVAGDSYPMEMHLVHQNDAGELAVVGLFFERGDENEVLAEVFENIEASAEDSVALDSAIDLLDLIPEESLGWAYAGSLTTPPCSEGVKWNVYAEPLSLSAAQLQSFTDVYDDSYRPVQDNRDVEQQVEESEDE